MVACGAVDRLSLICAGGVGRIAMEQVLGAALRVLPSVAIFCKTRFFIRHIEGAEILHYSLTHVGTTSRLHC